MPDQPDYQLEVMTEPVVEVDVPVLGAVAVDIGTAAPVWVLIPPPPVPSVGTVYGFGPYGAGVYGGGS